MSDETKSAPDLCNPKVVHQFVIVLEARNCNPNGDPAMDNLPRQDPRTGKGIVTGVAFKRRMRDYVHDNLSDDDGREIFVRSGEIFKSQICRALGDGVSEENINKHLNEKTAPTVIRDAVVQRYWDIRAFGAVLNAVPIKGKGKTSFAGQNITGPVQIFDGNSVAPIRVIQGQIGRVVHHEDEKNGTFGTQNKVGHAIYVLQGTFDASRAASTGYTEEDMAILWESVCQSYGASKTSSKGMDVIALLVFSHSSSLGSDNRAYLFNRVKVEANNPLPQTGEDYTIKINVEGMTKDVKLRSLTFCQGGVKAKEITSNISQSLHLTGPIGA